jgi:hypothetical protein
MPCTVFVDEPFKDNLDPRILRGRGGRNCPDGTPVLVRVRVRHHRRWRLDKTLAEDADTGSSVTLLPIYTCPPGNSRKTVFTELIIKGLKYKSDRVTVTCGK